MPDNPTPAPQVRVEVPFHCFACSPCPQCSDAGHTLATLADPDALALMADGETLRGMRVPSLDRCREVAQLVITEKQRTMPERKVWREMTDDEQTEAAREVRLVALLVFPTFAAPPAQGAE